jgi:predicted phosphoribosyltransferase
MFINRKDAGEQLGQALKKYESVNPILLGIPRGGIEVGYYAALQLKCEFDILVVRKLGHPRQPEAAFGALAEDGSLYLDPWSNQYLNKETIEEVIEREKEEIDRRINTYRKNRKLPELKGRTVILVDDGIATGATLFAAIYMCQKRNPKKLIVAAPISAEDQLSKIQTKVDETVILESGDHFFAVSQGYKDFANLTDKLVLHYLDLWQENLADKMEPE